METRRNPCGWKVKKVKTIKRKLLLECFTLKGKNKLGRTIPKTEGRNIHWYLLTSLEYHRRSLQVLFCLSFKVTMEGEGEGWEVSIKPALLQSSSWGVSLYFPSLRAKLRGRQMEKQKWLWVFTGWMLGVTDLLSPAPLMKSLAESLRPVS